MFSCAQMSNYVYTCLETVHPFSSFEFFHKEHADELFLWTLSPVGELTKAMSPHFILWGIFFNYLAYVQSLSLYSITLKFNCKLFYWIHQAWYLSIPKHAERGIICSFTADINAINQLIIRKWNFLRESILSDWLNSIEKDAKFFTIFNISCVQEIGTN